MGLHDGLERLFNKPFRVQFSICFNDGRLPGCFPISSVYAKFRAIIQA